MLSSGSANLTQYNIILCSSSFSKHIFIASGLSVSTRQFHSAIVSLVNLDLSVNQGRLLAQLRFSANLVFFLINCWIGSWKQGLPLPTHCQFSVNCLLNRADSRVSFVSQQIQFTIRSVVELVTENKASPLPNLFLVLCELSVEQGRLTGQLRFSANLVY